MRVFKDFFSAKNVFSVRNVVLMGVMLALCVVINFLTTKYATADFKLISFSYLPGVAVSGLLGPWAALAYGFAADILKYITLPVGPYIFGYTLSEMVMNLIYAAFFFRRKYRRPWALPLAAVLAQLSVMAVVTMGINYIWQIMYFSGAAGGFFAVGRMINRIVQFPVHVILVIAVAKFAEVLGKRGRFGA